MKMTLHSKNLQLSADTETLQVEFRSGLAEWSMKKRPYLILQNGEIIPFPAPSRAELVKTGVGEEIRFLFADWPMDGFSVRTKIQLFALTDEVVFQVIASGDKQFAIRNVAYPASMDFGKASGDTDEMGVHHLPRCYTVLPLMQGALIPVGTKPFAFKDCGLIQSRDSYMSFFGQVRNENAYTAIYETMFDVQYAFDDDQVQPLWMPSLGKMTGTRKIRFKFMEHADYNDMAAFYRGYMKEHGMLRTLQEKADANPNVKKLAGCPVIHERIARFVSPDSEYYDKENPENNHRWITFETRRQQLMRLHDLGVEKAYTHFDGWGKHGYDNLHPSPFPPCADAGGEEGMRNLAKTTAELGYIFGIHDQYRDYYYDAPDFDIHNAVQYADGTNPFCSIWQGGKQTVLCSALAADYVKRNYAQFKELDIPIAAAYLDVFSVVPMDECFSPDHPATREECCRNRRHCLDILSDESIIPSSEEGIDCIMPSIVLCHHAPLYTEEYYDSVAIGIPVPLLSLVYHDCLVMPWIGKRGSRFFKRASRGGFGMPITDSGYCYANLLGDPIYLDIEADEEEISEMHEVCARAGSLFYTPLTHHEFTDDAHRIQKTCFADGTEILVNFDTEDVNVIR